MKSLKTTLGVTTVGFVTLMGGNFFLSKSSPELADKWYVTAFLGSLGVTLASYGNNLLSYVKPDGSPPCPGV